MYNNMDAGDSRRQESDQRPIHKLTACIGSQLTSHSLGVAIIGKHLRTIK